MARRLFQIFIILLLSNQILTFKFNENKRLTCSGDGGKDGTCMSRVSCSKLQGTPSGLCGLFGICCILSSCELKTDSKISIFTNPSSSMLDKDNDCSYNIDANNVRVCQMRIDFETFSLAQPTTTIASPGVNGPGYKCRDDQFQVTGNVLDDAVPILCGENTGQHIYTRINVSSGVNGIRLSFRTVSRSDRPNLPPPSWRIRVTQLECFNTGQRRSTANVLANKKSTADVDEHKLAPMGCLQYYPERAGAFESFNYNGGSGPYLGKLFYAICFKRTRGICGIRLTTSQFEMAYVKPDIGYVDADCQTQTQGDYLFLPEAQASDGVEASKWCGTSVQGQVVAVTPPGPLYIYFKSDDLITQNINEIGYRFNFNALSNCNA